MLQIPSYCQITREYSQHNARPHDDHKKMAKVLHIIGENIEHAEPGKIFIGRHGSARNLTLHAMTHACVPNNPTFLRQPLRVRDGAIIGYHGLRILVATVDVGIERKIHIDEGMAERNASIFPNYNLNIEIPGFETRTQYYDNVGQLTRTTTPFGHPNAHEWAKTNNVPAFVRTHLRIPTSQPVTAEHLVEVMNRYSAAWERGGGF